MESVAELKKIVQKSQVNYKSPWYARKVIRKISVYITWFFLHTNVTANQVTILQLIVSLIGIGLLCSGDSWIAFAGVFLLHLGYVFDCVDGEIARYKKTQSVSGMFLDFVNHVVLSPMVFGCVAFHYYFSTGLLYYFYLGVAIIVLKIPSVGSARYSAINYLIENRRSPNYDVRNYQLDGKEEKHPDPDVSKSHGGLIDIINTTRKTIGRLLSYPNDFLTITILILIELITRNSLYGRYLLNLCTMYFAISFILDIYLHLKNKIPEREFVKYIQGCMEIAENIETKKYGNKANE